MTSATAATRGPRTRVWAPFVVTCLLAQLVPVGSFPTRVGALLFLIIAIGSWSRLSILNRRVAWLVLLALASGVVTLGLSKAIGIVAAFDGSFAMESLLAIASLGGTAMLTSQAMAIAGGRVGLVASVIPIIATPLANSVLLHADPWKYAYAWPVSVTLIAIVGSRRYTASALALALAAFSAAQGFRAALVVLLVTSICGFWLAGRTAARVFARERSGASTMVLSTLGAVAIYLGGSLLVSGYNFAALGGYLGNEIQRKQTVQSDAGVGLLTGGRSEIGATAALFGNSPIGYGIGAIPDNRIVYEAQAGYQEAIKYNSSFVNADPSNVIGPSGAHLHSTAADLWFSFGLGGAILVVMIVLMMLRAVRFAVVGNSSMVVVMTLMALWCMWDLAFSPLRSNWYYVGVALGASIYLVQHHASKYPTAPQRRDGIHQAQSFTAGGPS